MEAISFAPMTADHVDLSPFLDPRAAERALRAAASRKRAGRPRGVDPATSEHDYTDEEMEFLRAIEAYKASTHRKFPAWSEVFHVLRSLGYEKSCRVVEAG